MVYWVTMVNCGIKFIGLQMMIFSNKHKILKCNMTYDQKRQ